jgi:hypothetical protein
VALKNRFRILDNKPFHSFKTQVKLVLAAFCIIGSLHMVKIRCFLLSQLGFPIILQHLMVLCSFG